MYTGHEKRQDKKTISVLGQWWPTCPVSGKEWLGPDHLCRKPPAFSFGKRKAGFLIIMINWFTSKEIQIENWSMTSLHPAEVSEKVGTRLMQKNVSWDLDAFKWSEKFLFSVTVGFKEFYEWWQRLGSGFYNCWLHIQCLCLCHVSFWLTTNPQILVSRSWISSFVMFDPEARRRHFKQSTSDCGEAATFWAVSVHLWGLFTVCFISLVFTLKPQRSQCRGAHASQNKGVITLQPASCRGSPGALWPTAAHSNLPGSQGSTHCRNNWNCCLMFYLLRKCVLQLKGLQFIVGCIENTQQFPHRQSRKTVCGKGKPKCMVLQLGEPLSSILPQFFQCCLSLLKLADAFAKLSEGPGAAFHTRRGRDVE